jgi:VCBS repeat-containing protein
MKSSGTSRRAPAQPAHGFRSLALIGVAVLLPFSQALAVKPAGTGQGKFECSISDPVQPIVVGELVTFEATVTGGKPPYTAEWSFTNATPGTATGISVETTFDSLGQQQVALTATDSNKNAKTCTDGLQVLVEPAYSSAPTARGDTYATPVGKPLEVAAARVSGVLYNDFDTDPITGEQTFGDTPAAGLTAELVSGPSYGSLNLAADGSFDYTPDGTQGDNANDSFTYQVRDADGELSNVATVNIHTLSDQPDFKIMMNYELGMHCTGFEFSYCCILPPYNSIVAQVVKPQALGALQSNADYPRLLEGDPNNGLDGLGRETVLRDYDGSGNFQKYYLEYYHDAMPRREGNMPGTFNTNADVDTLISDIEGNSMLYWNTPYDSARVDTDGSITGVPGKLVTATYAGVPNVVVGDGSFRTPTNLGIEGGTDNFANGWLNHLYIYEDLEGSNPANTSREADKIRLGVAGMIEYPKNVGAALQPMGPEGNVSPFDNVLTFSGDAGTKVFTQSNVLENLPIQLTSPRIWEALGLPLTPFEDSIAFFAEPGSVDEDSVRPFVAMKAKLRYANCDEATGVCTKGDVVMGSNGQPVIGFGAAPIDIPNCERCHSAPAYQDDGVTPNVNSPNYVRRQSGPNPFYGPAGETLEAITDLEIEYWKFIYPSLQTGTDWYARLKGAAINMMMLHDYDVDTNFTANFPTSNTDVPNDLLDLPDYKVILQNTRMGHESIVCQKCHGDNVIAAVKAAGGPGWNIPPISEAIHNSHKAQSAGGPIVFNDSLGRFGGCQGCHPAHRSDGSMDKYPITYGGNNANADGDNRTGKGGCFVGRDVHSNPLKDVDGAETPSYLNAVGEWLVDNVAMDTGQWRGIWCTNCHTQLSQELWRAEDCDDLINGDCVVNPRGEPTLASVAEAVGLTEQQAIDYLDPKNPDILGDRDSDQTHAAWDPTIPDANVATIEVGPAGPVFTYDEDGDRSVNILSFCTAQDCVDRINNNKTDPTQWRHPANPFIDTANTAAAVPFSDATDGRDHWLAAGEPHCADCHAAPYVEQTGTQSPMPPFNYPAKAGLMRYSKGHQGISCQGCHESIHGLYPVGPAIDNTSYAQAAALNDDGSHGPLKCGTCHQVDQDGVPFWINGSGNWGGQFIRNFDAAIGWAHTYTDDANVLGNTCQNCHGDQADDISATEAEYLRHAYAASPQLVARTSRLMMDKAEVAHLGHVLGGAYFADGTPREHAEVADERDDLCSTCHSGDANLLGTVTCSAGWKQHLTRGMVAESVWEDVSLNESGTGNTLCGW